MIENYGCVNIISDCFDDNAKMRQMSRVASFLKLPVFYSGVPDFSSVTASGMLIDALDSAEDRPAIFIVNVAPRHNLQHKYTNGAPFGFFYYKNSLIISTLSEPVLSMIKRFNISEKIMLAEVDNNIDIISKAGFLPAEKIDQIKKTQFRSFEFVPRLAAFLATKGKEGLITEEYKIDSVNTENAKIWFIDNFGNAKTTVLPSECNFVAGQKLVTKFGIFNMFDRLKDVPDNENALIIGSSGLGGDRFVEVVCQGQNIAKKLDLNIGDSFL